MRWASAVMAVVAAAGVVRGAEVGTFVTAVVAEGAQGQPDRIDYVVNVIVSRDDNQGWQMLGFDIWTDLGVQQPLPISAPTETWWNSSQRYVCSLFCEGGFGTRGCIDDPHCFDEDRVCSARQMGDDILSAGLSLGLVWDADADDNPNNGFQPAKRAGVGQCFYFGDPCGPHDGEFINGGRWPLVVGSIVLEDVNGRSTPPGTHSVEFAPFAANVIRDGIDLTRDWPNEDGNWIEQVPVENLFGSVLEFTVTEDGRIVDLVIHNELHMVADFDCDGDVDISDFGFFSACFAGSGVPVDEGCLPADADGDGDVDIADFALLAGDFTGSQ